VNDQPMEDSDMRTHSSTPQASWTRLFLLMALCALFAVAAGLAQTPQAPAAAVTPQASAAMLQVVPSVAQFLATLSGNASNTAGQICHTNADCGRGELCCYPCGIPDCNFICMKVKRCPLIP
jgi:hypothetical protein